MAEHVDHFAILLEIFATRRQSQRRGPHKHRCPRMSCLFIWEHDTDTIKTDEEYAKAHLCPECGAEERFVFSE